MTPGTPVNFVLPEPDLDSPTFLEKVEEYECSVTALELVQLQLDKQGKWRSSEVCRNKQWEVKE